MYKWQQGWLYVYGSNWLYGQKCRNRYNYKGLLLKKDIRLVIKFLNFQIKLYHVIWLIHVKTRQVARTIIWAVLHAHVQKDTAELIVQLVRIEMSSCKHQKLLIKKKKFLFASPQSPTMCSKSEPMSKWRSMLKR